MTVYHGFIADAGVLPGINQKIHDLAELAQWRTAATLSRGFVNNVHNPGTPIWERDWDVLLILDACRTDLMREVAHEYEFIGNAEKVGTHWSVASKSSDWLRRTFIPEYADKINRTAYVTGNPFTAKIDLSVGPTILDEVWKYAWDDEHHTVPARPLTNQAIKTWRNRDDHGIDRMIVHYMQPHGPFIHNPEIGDYGQPEDFGHGFGDMWTRIGDEYTVEEVWAAYRDNLRYVLDDVEIVLRNLDADQVAISADHGNEVGKFGVYGHPHDLLLPSIRRVPWVVTQGEDTGEYTVEATRAESVDMTDEEVQERLQSLGYTE